MLYDKLTTTAKSWCDVNDFKTDDKIIKIIKELRVCLRLDYDVTHAEYKKMNNSQIIERYIDESKDEVFYGS